MEFIALRDDRSNKNKNLAEKKIENKRKSRDKKIEKRKEKKKSLRVLKGRLEI